MSAPEWGQGYGLSRSGRWHLIAHHSGTLCGTYVYRDREINRGSWRNERLVSIADGIKPALICKKCAKAKAAQETTPTK